MDNFHQLACPHCSGTIIVLHHELNCRIFRHGAFVSNGEPIPPHSSRAECDRLVAQNLIVGCGKPFRVVLQDGVETAIECDYI
jgi:DNA-directed RNA polymerase subunit RPC12/RpoP